MITSGGLNIIQALQKCVGTALDDNAKIKRHSSKQSMEECQNADKIINDASKASHLAESPNVKSDNDGIAINKSDKQSIDPQPISYQENLPESSVTTDQSQQGRGTKRKLDDLEDRSTTTELDLGISSQRNQWRMTEGIKPRIKDAPTIFTLEKNTRNRIRNGRMTIEGRPFLRRHVSSPKYASFLRMFCKEEVDELRGNSSSRRDDGEKLQRRRDPSTQRYNIIEYKAERKEKKDFKKFQELRRDILLYKFFFYNRKLRKFSKLLAYI